LYYLTAGLSLVIISYIIKSISRLNDLINRKVVTNILLSSLTLFLFLFIIELSLIPIFRIPDKLTTIFMRDDELGWKLRPGAEDVWGGVKVSINDKGLQGPELSYDKPDNVKRILYLGDSVTFGYMLENYKQAFPYQIEEILEDNLRVEIETINVGVGGYSPWQEYIFLTREGVKYDADLVVLGFVLNDITEKFGLIRFGGEDFGGQLWHNTQSRLSWLFESRIAYVIRWVSAKVRFGRDIEQGAKLTERIAVNSLIERPDSPNVKKAWELTLNNVEKIFDYCKEREIPLLLIIFPYAFQLDSMNADPIPQKILTQFAVDGNIPVIDLLPVLADKMMIEEKRSSDYFLDHSHLSMAGSRVVADVIAGYIQGERLNYLFTAD